LPIAIIPELFIRTTGELPRLIGRDWFCDSCLESLRAGTRKAVGSGFRHSSVLTLHCTRKLLKHLHAVVRADSLHPTTCLGDWYANLLFTERLRLIICVSERSLLPVFVVAKDPASFVPRFQRAVQSVLECIGVPPESLNHEARQMAKVMTDATANRSVLGSLNDLAFLARTVIDEQPEIDLTVLAIEVAETPCAPLKYESPRSVSLSLLRTPLI
jgi:hypothetical protein